MIVEALPKAVKKIFYVVVDLIQLVMFAYLVQPSFTYLQRTIENNQVSTAMGIPMQVIYVAPLIGFILAVIRCIQDVYFQFTGKGSQKPAPEEA